MRYIMLDADKQPTEKLTDGGHNWDLVKECRNIGLLIDEPYIVFDFDDSAEADVMLKIVDALKMKVRVMKTTRGIHVWFKSPSPRKNSIKVRCAIGLHYDVRSWGKYSYVVVKKDGKMREWLRKCSLEEMEEPPYWLNPVMDGSHFLGMGDGDGRNQALFNYIFQLQKRKYTKEQVKRILILINQFVFKSPLPKGELKTICRDEAFKSEEEMATIAPNWFDEKGHFLHNIFSEYITQTVKIIYVNQSPYVYEDGIYIKAIVPVERLMLKLYPLIKKNQRAEVWDYIRILTHTEKQTIGKDDFVMVCNNGRLDIRTKRLEPFSPEFISFTKLPVTYDSQARSDILEKTIGKVFCGDEEVISLFYEMVGYALMKNNRFRKGFLFVGGGANGKSTILNMLKRFFGDANTSTIELAKLGDRFNTAELEDKLVNIGDDIDKGKIEATGVLKKLFTGESLTVEHKQENPYTMRSYAKLIFSCNELPYVADDSYGMQSRLVIVPFNATFTADDADFDPFIEDKLTSQEALSALLNKALDGLRRLLARQGFTLPKKVVEATERYRIENSSVLSWAEENDLTLKRCFDANSVEEVYNEYKSWCAITGIQHPVSGKSFRLAICKKFAIKSTRKNYHDKNGYRNFYIFEPDI